jgi:hypothetical protein
MSNNNNNNNNNNDNRPALLEYNIQYSSRFLWHINCLYISIINIREYRRVIKNGHSRETGKTWYTRRRNTKQKQNAI